MITAIRSFAALVFLTVQLSVSAVSWHDDSHYVPLGPRTPLPRLIPPTPSVKDTEPTRLPSASTATVSYPRRPLTSFKRCRTNFTLGASVPLFGGRAGCRTRKHFLANPKEPNAGPTVSSPITRSRFTIHLKVAVEEGVELAKLICSRADDRRARGILTAGNTLDRDRHCDIDVTRRHGATVLHSR
jgi:hypothetical protein